VRNGHTYISDLGSQNGTTVNAVRIQSSTELHDGDVIYFADIAARYRAPGQGPFAPAGQDGQMNVGQRDGRQRHRRRPGRQHLQGAPRQLPA